MSQYEQFDKSIKFRCDDSIIKFVGQLAIEAERTPSEFLRDLIFYLRMTRSGPIICAHMLQEGIHYRPRKPFEAPKMEKEVFPWTMPGENTKG